MALPLPRGGGNIGTVRASLKGHYETGSFNPKLVSSQQNGRWSLQIHDIYMYIYYKWWQFLKFPFHVLSLKSSWYIKCRNCNLQRCLRSFHPSFPYVPLKTFRESSNVFFSGGRSHSASHLPLSAKVAISFIMISI